jgi:hypothetical protein
MATSTKLFYSSVVVLAAMALAAIYLTTFWPGILTTDSMHQFVQARSGNYDDWHPPLMAFFWSFLLFTTPPSAGYLIFQVTLLCLGFALLALSPLLSAKKPFWLALLAAICPPIWIYAGVLWKDILLAALWLCCTGALLCAKNSLEGAHNSKSWYRLMMAAAIMFGLLGCMTRINAVPAFAPLAFIIPVSRTLKTRIAAAFGLIVVALGMNAALDATLNVRRAQTSSALYIFDLGGITSFEGDVKFPGNWSEDERRQLVEKCYYPQAVNHYIWGECKFVNDKIQAEKLWGSPVLRNAWLDAIYRHPVSYIKHRLYHFYIFLQNPWGHRVTETSKNDLGFEFQPGTMFEIMTAFVSAGEQAGLFYPQGWLIFGMILFPTTFLFERRPTLSVIQAAILSALLYFASFIPGGVASDFRYGYWPITALTVSTLYLVQLTIVSALGKFNSRRNKTYDRAEGQVA